ncbi:MAG: cytochrome c maturation protein CcmE [Hyphomicrobiaceae bacterium]
MTRKQKRAVMIGGGVAVLCASAILVLFALKDSIVFFHTPSDVAAQKVSGKDRFRLGGLVAKDSVERGVGTKVKFSVTDTIATVPVIFDGILPDLFREGQGVVTEGRLDANGTFLADSVLAKHDENYMPPEVAAALKEQGVELGKTSEHPDAKD